MKSSDEQLAAIAAKSHKETLYHLQWSGDWVLRLGDGTEESHGRMQQAVNELWPYSNEIVTPSETDVASESYGVSLADLKARRDEKIKEVMAEATLETPENNYSHLGGKDGKHSEHLGFILADLQFSSKGLPWERMVAC